jgi:hypothetical protein
VLSQSPLPGSLSSRDLVKELFSDVALLVQQQLKLAQLEGKRQMRRERVMAELVSSGAIVGYAAVIVLVVAAALAIGDALGGRAWLGALIVSGGLLIVAACAATIGWARRVQAPLHRSRSELSKEITWARHKVTS